MTSAAFERFRFSFFEDKNSARDGLATSALAGLQGEEATRAEAMLIGFLPDTRGVIGLGILRSRRAEPKLTRMFEAEQRAQHKAEAAGDEPWPTDQLVYLAKALWQIRPDRRWLDAILGALASGDDWQRQMAVEELRGVGDPVIVPALIGATRRYRTAGAPPRGATASGNARPVHRIPGPGAHDVPDHV